MSEIMNTDEIRSFYYPPGGILIWIIILMELITFGAGIVAFSYYKTIEPDVFSQSKEVLNTHIGFANTLLLLTSGFFMAKSVQFLKLGNRSKSELYMWFTIIIGIGFLVLKGYEFSVKLDQGYSLSHNTFFMFYWLLAGFHYMHVLVGLTIITTLNFYVRKGVYHADNFLDVESGASFWHMCDLIWLMLFPVLYLL